MEQSLQTAENWAVSHTFWTASFWSSRKLLHWYYLTLAFFFWVSIFFPLKTDGRSSNVLTLVHWSHWAVLIDVSWNLGTLYFMTVSYTFDLPYEVGFLFFFKSCSQLLLFRSSNAVFGDIVFKTSRPFSFRKESQSIWNDKSLFSFPLVKQF